MPLAAINPTTTKAWKALKAHFEAVKQQQMQHLFEQDPERSERFSLEFEDLYIDYSKNRITNTTMDLLIEFASEMKLNEAIQLQQQGDGINETEGRAVLHTALRDFHNVKPEVSEARKRMKEFSEAIIQGNYTGYTGKKIKTIVNIGIGGSDLGPKMVIEALGHYRNHLDVQFIANIDGDFNAEKLEQLDPETTLFIVVSKSFTTQETLTNAKAIKEWFVEKASEEAVATHFVAVTANLERAKDFGIRVTSIFPMWDWVGGRFSLWGTVGLSISCAIGYANFEQLLQGANAMDKYFKDTEFSENMPVVLGLLSIWYTNFFKAETEAVVPYSQYLSTFVPYLQQAVMESNGKHVDRNHESVTYATSPVVWGSTGTNAQHAFFQLLHQGTRLIPVDFILFSQSLFGNGSHQDLLAANCFAQSEALLQGTYGKGTTETYKDFEGNRPSNTLLLKKLTPYNLGSLIALYEHKIFVQGVLWNIYSFDQWGVELGKQLATNSAAAIKAKDVSSDLHSASASLIRKYLNQ